MNFCAWCKKNNPHYQCGHCYKVWYCDRECQKNHAPYHLHGKSETQRLIIPSGMDLILPNTHYHDAGGGIIPYTAKSVRILLEKTGGDVKKFDKLMLQMVLARKKFITDYIHQEKLLLLESVFDPEQNVWLPKSYDIVGTLINPFVSFKSQDVILSFIQKAFDDPNVSLIQKKTALNTFFKKIMDNEEYLSYLKYFMFDKISFSKCGKQTCMAENQSTESIREIFEMYDLATKQILQKYKLEQIISFYSKQKDDGLKYAIIPGGTFLYRGFGSDRSGIGLSFSRKHDYFGFDYGTTIAYQTSRQTTEIAGDWAKKKSGVSVFTVKDNLHVLDLTDVNTVRLIGEKMLENGDVEIYNSFSVGWKILEKEQKIRRSSGSGACDDITVNWLCANGFDGYIGYGFTLSDELVLCDPRSVLKLELKKTHVEDFFIDLKLNEPGSMQGLALINEY